MLNKYAPLRKNFPGANYVTCITKTLKKAMIYRSQLKTKYLKFKTQADLKAYIRQKIFYGNLYKKAENIMNP